MKVLATGDHFLTWVTSASISLLRNALAFHVDLDAHIGEADRLLADVAGAPHGRDVEVALEFELELVDDPAAVNGVGVQADRKARAERGE